MASYRVLIKASAAKELDAIGQKADRARVVAKIRALGEEPRPHGCELLAGAMRLYRVRVGDHRIVYSIDDGLITVYVVKVGHRRDVDR